MKHFACKLTAIIMAVMIGIVFFPAEGLAVESEVTEPPTVKAGKDNAVMSQNTENSTTKITASIAAPFMNDASKTAYNDNITQSIREKEGEKDTYIITIALDEDYLADSDRQYPVTFDPSFTWDTNSEFWSVYVGSGYKNTNFHDSGIKIINAGKNSTGVFRTYLRFNGFPEKIKGKSVTKATMALYETGSGTAGQTVQAHRVTENWTRNGLTWNNRPAYVSSSCYDSFNNN